MRQCGRCPGPCAAGTGQPNLTLAADKLAEADYAFKPSSMPEVRGYGQLFGHVANAQFGGCSAARGVPNPNMGINNEQKTTKAEIAKAFAALTEENGAQFMAQGRGQMARSAILAGLIAHSNEMYGTAAVYLRAKNVVPPSTEGAQQQPQRGGGPGRGGEDDRPTDQRQAGCWQSQRSSVLSPACLQ